MLNKTVADALKTVSNEEILKTAEVTSDLIGNTIIGTPRIFLSAIIIENVT